MKGYKKFESSWGYNCKWFWSGVFCNTINTKNTEVGS